MKTKPLFEMLQEHPALAMQSTDDEKCKALFSMLGVLDDFTRDVTPNTCTLAIDIHPTHWVLGFCHSGNNIASENGYNVACLPKASYSREQFYEFVKEMGEKESGTDIVKRTIRRPNGWRAEN